MAMESPKGSIKTAEATEGARKFVDIGQPNGETSKLQRTDQAFFEKLAGYDADSLEGPYLKELIDVLDRVENEGEPYLEKLIVQAGLDFSSLSETDINEKRPKLHKLRLAKSKSKTAITKKKSIRGAKTPGTKMGIVEPASEDNYRGLYGTYKEGGGVVSSEESLYDSSTTSTESLIHSLAEMIAKGEPPLLNDEISNQTTYGSKIIPYGSFTGGENDAGVTKPTKSDVLLRGIVAEIRAVSPPEEGGEKLPPEDPDCADESPVSSVVSEHYSEDFYDEGKNRWEVFEEDGPEMVLLSSSDDDDTDPPHHYYEYNQKESQCLAIVNNFRRQFTDAYPQRKPLFLTPVNGNRSRPTVRAACRAFFLEEVGVPRFVCTTVRPTIFSYSELFQWDGIARFFSYQMEYILLNPPDVPPSVVMSPSSILKERQGSCFDYCFLLASVLVGVGYDAYIVNGYASAAICAGDESHRMNPTLSQDVIPEEIPQYERDFDFSEMQSEMANEVFAKTIQRQRAEKAKERNANIKGLTELLEKERIRAGPQRDLDEEEDEETDPYEGRRVHAWIVVLPGKRDITDPFYIDPFTGTAFPVSHLEFLNIESIWNHRQYYVNMQQQPAVREVLTWDLSDQQKWEAMFTDRALGITHKDSEDRADSQDFISMDDCGLLGDLKGTKSGCQGPGWPFKGFEMPRPWSDPLTISRKRYLRFCKNGYRLHRYLKCDMEYYHHYERKDGLVNKYILFSNKRKTHISEVKEVYENRRDRLKYRKHIVKEGILREYFIPGHSKAIRTHEMRITSTPPPKFSELYKALNTYAVAENAVRTVTYYHEYRNDRLEKLEQRGEEIFWYYAGRNDCLTDRYFKYGTQIDRSYAVEALKCKGDQRPVAIVREKFDRDPEIDDPDLDVHIREYDVVQNRLLLIYQPAKNLVCSTQRRFVLPDFNETPQGGAELPAGYLRMNEDVMLAIFRDQLHEEHRVPVDIWDEMVNNYKLSLQAIVNIRRSEDDFKDEMSLRVEEEQDPALWHSAYDVERHPRAAAILKKAEQNTLLQKPSKEPGDAVFDPQTFDWVSPYMAAYGGKEVTSLDDAVAIRTAVLEDMRERLLYTANALQKSHEDEFNRLQILNGKFRKAQVSGEMTPKEYIAYENEKSGIQFKMHMLERRQELLQYEGPAKLKRLNDWILKDPRFADWLRGLHLGTKEHVVGDQLMKAGKGDGKLSPGTRRKVWKLDPDEGDIVVEPLNDHEEPHAWDRDDAHGSSFAAKKKHS